MRHLFFAIVGVDEDQGAMELDRRRHALDGDMCGDNISHSLDNRMKLTDDDVDRGMRLGPVDALAKVYLDTLFGGDGLQHAFQASLVHHRLQADELRDDDIRATEWHAARLAGIEVQPDSVCPDLPVAGDDDTGR